MKISLVQQRSRILYKPVSYYMPRQHKGWKGLIQKYCYRFLNHIGDHVFEEPDTVIEAIVIDTNNIATLIQESINEFMKHNQSRPEVVLMGWHEFHSLFNDPKLGQETIMLPITFPVDGLQYEWRKIKRYGGEVRARTIFNLQVVVIPWMDGIVILPSEKELKLNYE